MLTLLASCYGDRLAERGEHPCDACRECEECVLLNGRPECYAPSSVGRVCLDGGVIWSVDGCGAHESPVMECGEHTAGCVATDGGAAECACDGHFTGEDCATCPEPWDPALGCEACLAPWTGEDCDECHPGFDPRGECRSCLPGFEGSDCAPCLDPEVCDGVDNDCDGVVDGPEAEEGCGPNEDCVDESCRCKPENECAGGCVDYLDDSAHCGSCGNACAPGFGCEDGECVNIDDCLTLPGVCGTHSSCGFDATEALPVCACEPGYGSVDGSRCLSAVLQIAVGTFHGCALLDGGVVKCWGLNTSGQLGHGDTVGRGDGPLEMGDALPQVDLGPGRVVAFIDGGAQHNCALLSDGAIKCWGSNSVGQLGLGNARARGDEPGELGDALATVDLGAGRTALELSVGDRHACAILDDGALKCWGANEAGQLGQGDTENRGDHPDELGDALPAVDLGAGRSAVRIAAGRASSCAILDDGAVKCWGANEAGQLGLGDTTHRGDAAGELGDALPVVELGSGFVAVEVALGDAHTCAVSAAGDVKCWGSGTLGALGVGGGQALGDGAAEMGDSLPAVSLGANRVVRTVALGTHSCAVFDDGALKCWGYNYEGQLGLEHNITLGTSSSEMGDNLLEVALGTGGIARGVAASTYHTCVLLESKVAKCWGLGSYGQLGRGNTNIYGDDPGEMGDASPAVRVSGD